MAGYQGWFTAEGDETNRGWSQYGLKGDTAAGVDFWPDMKEYTKKYLTPFKMGDGSDSYLYSAYDEESVDLHFKWMKEYGIDGVFMCRFVGATKDADAIRHFNKVLENALKAARKYDRAISLMYDLSGCSPEDMAVMEADWRELLNLFDLINPEKHPTYLHHNGHPLLGIWGVGFCDNRRYSVDDALQAIARIKNEHSVSIMLGVPFFWRTLDGDTEDDPLLHTLIKEYVDIVMPWAVGRYNNDNYDAIEKGLSEDFKWCQDNKALFVPLVYPGFSWANLKPGLYFQTSHLKGDLFWLNVFKNPEIYDQIPRLKGDFFWKQVAGAKKAGASSLFIAMFDEVNEGTAIFKCAEEGQVPIFGKEGPKNRFVGIEAGLGSDYYLWLAGEAGRWMRGESGYNAIKPVRK